LAVKEEFAPETVSMPLVVNGEVAVTGAPLFIVNALNERFPPRDVGPAPERTMVPPEEFIVPLLVKAPLKVHVPKIGLIVPLLVRLPLNVKVLLPLSVNVPSTSIAASTVPAILALIEIV